MLTGALALGGASALAYGYKAYTATSRATEEKARMLQDHMQYFRDQHSEQLKTVAGVSPHSRRYASSFDLFDTLVGRALPNPDSIFDIVESRSGVVGFATARKFAAACESSKNIDQVYAILASNPTMTSLANFDPQKLRDLEWQVELENAVLIKSNVDKLQATPAGVSIIIISDTFYSADKLRELLVHLNMPRIDEITIFASRSGKADGWVWSVISEAYNIVNHLGDNFMSDFWRARESTFVAQPLHSSTAHTPTTGEQLLFSLAADSVTSPEFAYASMMRSLSLANPYDFNTHRKEFFWYRLHCSYTIPIFWYYLHTIQELLEAHPEINRLALIFRDCINLQPMIQRYLLHGRGVFVQKNGKERPITVAPIPSSRRLLREQISHPNEDFLSFMREAMGGEDMARSTLVLDVNGTYRSVSAVCKEHFAGIPRAHYITQQKWPPHPWAKQLFTCAIPGIHTSVIEQMNVALAGSLIAWNGSRSDPFGGPCHVPCEYDDDFIDATLRAFNDSYHILDSHGPAIHPQPRVMVALLQKASSTLSDIIEHTDDHFALNAIMPLSGSARSARQQEVADYYDRIISSFGSRRWEDPLTLLDVLPTTSTAPWTMPWKEYLGKRVKLDIVRASALDTTKALAEQQYELVVLTIPSAHDTVLLASVWPKVKTYLALHLVTSSTGDGDVLSEELPENAKHVVAWPLTRGSDSIGPGVLFVFENALPHE